MEAVKILRDDLLCDPFVLTIPPSSSSLTSHIERPLLHRYRVKTALIIVDPHAHLRFSQIGLSSQPPCLFVSALLAICGLYLL